MGDAMLGLETQPTSSPAWLGFREGALPRLVELIAREAIEGS